jgi:enamine deaminase RidA (YjgF/YER057c/UK114 family)
MSAERKLAELGLTLPPRAAPLANYVGAVKDGRTVYVSGHVPMDPQGKPVNPGKVGRDVTPEQGYALARHAGLMVLATLRETVGSLDEVKRVVKVVGLVNATEDFTEHPKVVNGFSDLMVEIFGMEIGRHARSAIGVGSLPKGSAVEVEAVFHV